jgi:GR25 family glycosyltransferase involved in LPS biosynthesis
MSHRIDKIIYINLDHRTDRREQIESQLVQYGLTNFERFAAVHNPLNGIGCAQSHLAVLRLAKERGYKNILILEDDFVFIVDKPVFEETLSELFEKAPNFDVCFISYCLEEEQKSEFSFLKKVRFSSTASGYIINSHYYDAIIELYEWSVPLLEATGRHWLYANDQVWRVLQSYDNWYCTIPRLGVQSDGFSDNSQIFLARGV